MPVIVGRNWPKVGTMWPVTVAMTVFAALLRYLIGGSSSTMWRSGMREENRCDAR